MGTPHNQRDIDTRNDLLLKYQASNNAMPQGTEMSGTWLLSPGMVPSDGHEPVSTGASCRCSSRALSISQTSPVIFSLPGKMPRQTLAHRLSSLLARANIRHARGWWWQDNINALKSANDRQLHVPETLHPDRTKRTPAPADYLRLPLPAHWI